MDEPHFENLTCPMPHSRYDRVLLAHGGGGKLTAELIQRIFLPAFDNDILRRLEDQATLDLIGDATTEGENSAPFIAFTTDSFIVRPLFFPGGDIGRLAVNGTVNDLAVGGAIPKVLSAAFILEEGTLLEVVSRIAASMREACREASVKLVTGDTKVVDHGKGDQVFITTSGIGIVPRGRSLAMRNVRPGDQLVVSGTIGDHGMAIMSVREGLEFESVLRSDTAPLNSLTEEMLRICPDLRWMRDPTRGGVSSALNELAVAARVGVRIVEASVPVRPEVHSACEILGLDPLYVANEGKLIAAVPAVDVHRLVESMRCHPLGRDAAIIGEIVDDHPGLLVMQTVVGGERIVSMLSGEQLPRIC